MLYPNWNSHLMFSFSTLTLKPNHDHSFHHPRYHYFWSNFYHHHHMVNSAPTIIPTLASAITIKQTAPSYSSPEAGTNDNYFEAKHLSVMAPDPTLSLHLALKHRICIWPHRIIPFDFETIYFSNYFDKTISHYPIGSIIWTLRLYKFPIPEPYLNHRIIQHWNYELIHDAVLCFVSLPTASPPNCCHFQDILFHFRKSSTIKLTFFLNL